MADDLSLFQGTLDVLVLRTLAWGPRHGYAVARWIQDSTDDMRGGLGYEGLQELMKFVQEGGVLRRTLRLAPVLQHLPLHRIHAFQHRRLVGLEKVASLEQDATAGWLEQARDDRDGRGLPGAIWPQQPQHLARLKCEADVPDRRERRALRADGRGLTTRLHGLRRSQREVAARA